MKKRSFFSLLEVLIAAFLSIALIGSLLSSLNIHIKQLKSITQHQQYEKEIQAIQNSLEASFFFALPESIVDSDNMLCFNFENALPDFSTVKKRKILKGKLSIKNSTLLFEVSQPNSPNPVLIKTLARKITSLKFEKKDIHNGVGIKLWVNKKNSQTSFAFFTKNCFELT